LLEQGNAIDDVALWHRRYDADAAQIAWAEMLKLLNL